jgi:hypothetical protein
MEPKVYGGKAASDVNVEPDFDVEPEPKVARAILGKPTIITAEDQPHVPPVVEELHHETTDSWLQAIIACRFAGGDLVQGNNMRGRMLGFIHHPDVPGHKSVYHLISLTRLGSHPATPEALALLGMGEEDFQELVWGTRAWHRVLTGKDPEPYEKLNSTGNTREEMEFLTEIMMHEGVLGGPDLNGDPSQDAELVKTKDLGFMETERKTKATLRRHALKKWGDGATWVPKGWAKFVLPYDADRVGVWGEEVEGEQYGAFFRRGAGLLRVFEGGKWDCLQAYGTSYKVVTGGNCEDPERAVIAALSSEEAQPFPAAQVVDVPITGGRQ